MIQWHDSQANDLGLHGLTYLKTGAMHGNPD
jgi:hypothetical protein